MENYLHPDVRNIQISGIRKFVNRLSKYPHALSLTLGQPDFPTPDHIKTAAKRAIDDNMTVYSHNAGYPMLREAAASFVQKKYNLNYEPMNEVIVTVGASEAIDIALRGILEQGDEVILPSPVYPGYEPVIRMCGGIPVFIDTRENGFKLNVSQLEAHITERTKCIILPYPSNPTGTVLTEEEVSELASFLQSKNIFILSDEIYSELTYDSLHHSIASFSGMKEKTIVINGLSKSHSMTGWRIGFLFASASIVQHLLKIHQYNVSCASTISQAAAIEALTNGIEDAVPMREEYKRRRNYCIERLQKMELSIPIPGGAFYLFIPVKRFGLTSQEFAVQLLENEQVAVIPGDAFSEYGEGFVRISYAASMETLEKAMDALARFIQSLS